MKNIIVIVFILGFGLFSIWFLMWWYGQTDDKRNSDNFAQIEQIIPQGSSTNQRIVPSEVGFDITLVKPINEVFTSNRSQFQEVLNNLYTDVYGIYPCKISSKNSQVVKFTALPQGGDYITQYQAAHDAVLTWEPYIFMDIGSFIFSPERMPTQTNQISFSPVVGTSYRQAKVELADGPGNIFYGWQLNGVYFAESKACLEEVMEYINPSD